MEFLSPIALVVLFSVAFLVVGWFCIPVENVHYEMIINNHSEEERNLSQHALSKRVIRILRNSYYACLQAIVLELKG